jgi:hypothetical protein
VLALERLAQLQAQPMTSKIADSLFPLFSHSVLVLHDLFGSIVAQFFDLRNSSYDYF